LFVSSNGPLAFISYSRHDSEFVMRLASDLKKAGAGVWLDQLDISPGQRWDRAVEGALESSPALLVVLSASSVDSMNVMDEVSFALEKKKAVVPILMEDCPIPFRLRRIQHVDFRRDYSRGLSALLVHLGVSSPEHPAPPEPAEPDPAADTAEANRRADAEQAAHEEAERKAHEEAERQAHEAAEQKAREEAERKAQLEAEAAHLREALAHLEPPLPPPPSWPPSPPVVPPPYASPVPPPPPYNYQAPIYPPPPAPVPYPKPGPFAWRNLSPSQRRNYLIIAGLVVVLVAGLWITHVYNANVAKQKADALAMEAEAEKLYNQGSFTDAFPLAKGACDAGVPAGCDYEGIMYANGSGVAQDNSQAVALYRQSCDGNDMSGCRDLGYMYRTGTGIAVDYSQALTLYRRACDGGNAAGCRGLGYLYENGNGVTKDYTQAVAFYTKACDGGDAEGCSNLGAMYWNGNGVTQNRPEALVCYRKACDGKYQDACTFLNSQGSSSNPN
jgi:hypothetical protein